MGVGDVELRHFGLETFLWPGRRCLLTMMPDRLAVPDDRSAACRAPSRLDWHS